MPTARQIQPEAINRSLEMDIERNANESKPAGATFRQTHNGNDEIAANNLATLLRRVYEASTCEIDNLIGELFGLREKLEIDHDHLQSDIAKYAELSQGVMQLAAIVFRR